MSENSPNDEFLTNFSKIRNNKHWFYRDLYNLKNQKNIKNNIDFEFSDTA